MDQSGRAELRVVAVECGGRRERNGVASFMECFRFPPRPPVHGARLRRTIALHDCARHALCGELEGETWARRVSRAPVDK